MNTEITILGAEGSHIVDNAVEVTLMVGPLACFVVVKDYEIQSRDLDLIRMLGQLAPRDARVLGAKVNAYALAAVVALD